MPDEKRPSRRNLKRAAGTAIIFYLVVLVVILVVFNIANFRGFRHDSTPTRPPANGTTDAGTTAH